MSTVSLFLLLVSLSLLLLLGSLVSDALVLLLVLSSSQGLVGGLLWDLNGSWGSLRSNLGDWESSRNGNLLTFSLGLLVKDDQLGLVFVQSGDVKVEGLLRTVLSSVVNSDTDGSGVLWSQTSGLDLGQSETSTGSDLSVVLDGWTSHHWSQEVHWLWSHSGGLGGSGLTSGDLLASLVQVHSDTFLPVLSEVVLQDWLVLSDSHFPLMSCSKKI